MLAREDGCRDADLGPALGWLNRRLGRTLRPLQSDGLGLRGLSGSVGPGLGLDGGGGVLHWLGRATRQQQSSEADSDDCDERLGERAHG